VRDDDRGGHLRDQLLQALDAADVQMIGGLIEQQQLRCSGERGRERRAATLPAGCGLGGALGIYSEPVEHGGELRSGYSGGGAGEQALAQRSGAG